MEETTVKRSTLHPSFRPFRDYLITMVPIAVLATYVYGFRVPVMLGIASVTAVLCDLLVALLEVRHIRLSDISSVTFAWMVTLMLPAAASYGTVIFAVAATILLGSRAFGGYGNYPLHPAAFGFALTAISFPDKVFRFSRASVRVGLGWNVNEELYQSPAGTLHDGGVPLLDRSELILGDYAGAIGETFCLLAFAGLILLIVHYANTPQEPVSFLVTCAAIAYLFPRIPAGGWDSVLMEIFCTGIPFAACYLVAEPTIRPKHPAAKILYGILTGIFTMLIARYGVFERGACFAVLLTAPMGYYMDRRFLGISEERGVSDGE